MVIIIIIIIRSSSSSGIKYNYAILMICIKFSY